MATAVQFTVRHGADYDAAFSNLYPSYVDADLFGMRKIDNYDGGYVVLCSDNRLWPEPIPNEDDWEDSSVWDTQSTSREEV